MGCWTYNICIIGDGNVLVERIDVRWRALCSQTGRADGRCGGGVPAVRALHEEHAPRAGAQVRRQAPRHCRARARTHRAPGTV
jgi:hypothetical protein